LKILISNIIKSVTASSSNPAYPASRLLNTSPKKRWEVADASVTAATLTVGVSGVSGGLGLVNVFADDVDVKISDPNGISWQNVVWPGGGASDVLLDADTPLDPDTVLDSGVSGGVEWVKAQPALNVEYNWGQETTTGRALWVSFVQFSTPVTITIELRKSASNPIPISAGTLSVGVPIHVPGVDSLKEGLIDLSVYDQLANGATYYLDLGRLRVFSGSVTLKRNPYFYNFMKTFAMDNGRKPVMVSFMDSLTNSDFVMYGSLDVMPEGNHKPGAYSDCSFVFREAR